MSELSATNCGCGCESNFGGNSCIWIILLLLCCGGAETITADAAMAAADVAMDGATVTDAAMTAVCGSSFF